MIQCAIVITQKVMLVALSGRLIPRVRQATPEIGIKMVGTQCNICKVLNRSVTY